MKMTIDILIKIDKIAGKIKDRHGKSNAVGYEMCPLCGNKMKYTVSKVNGHVHMVCKTKNCLQIME